MMAGQPAIRPASSPLVPNTFPRVPGPTGSRWATPQPLSIRSPRRAFCAHSDGKIAAYTICDTLHGKAAAIDKYRLYVEFEYAHYRASHRAFYLQETRWPEAPFWARRHQQHGATNHAHSHV